MKVSVVIPAYNAEKTIERAINSVISQTKKVLEIIVINDGSTDRTANLVIELAQEYPYIKLINKANGGVSTARNLGIKESTGEWVAFLDSDDYWNANKIEKQLDALKSNPHIELLGTARNNEKFTNFLFKKIEYITPISSRLLLYKNFFSTPTVVIKKSIVENVGYFDENQKFAEEGDYWIRICNKHQCYLLNESLVTTDEKPYFGHSGLSGNIKEMEKGELKNLKMAYKIKVVNFFEYNFLRMYSILKYIRRVIIVKLR